MSRTLGSATKAHVIDFDSRRRAQLARELFNCGVHAEIYEDIEDFIAHLPSDGLVFLADEGSMDCARFFNSVSGEGQFFPLVPYSEMPSAERIVRSLKEGAKNYLQWPIEPRLLEATIAQLSVADDEIQNRRHWAIARKLVNGLTGREIDVLTSMIGGNSNKETAAELEISHRTVEIYRKSLIGKIGARSSGDAIRIGIYAGLGADIPLWPLHSAEGNSSTRAFVRPAKAAYLPLEQEFKLAS